MATHESLDEELINIRNQIVAIASRRRVSISELVNTGIVFTRDELLAATRSAPHQRSSSTAAGSVSMMVPGVSSSGGNTFGGLQVPGGLERSILSVGSTGEVTIARGAALHSSGDANMSDVSQSRYRPLPPGHQLRPDLPPDADLAWIEDEQRRASIPANIRDEFATQVVRPSSLHHSQDASHHHYTPGTTTYIRGPEAGDATSSPRTTWDMQSYRAFGVEMETCLAKRSDEFLLENAVKAIRDVVPTLRNYLGSDFAVGFVDYQAAKDDRAYKLWKITTDLSIRSEDGRPIFGLEFITPKLSGPYDLWKAEHFCDQLHALNFQVNTSTALHVHISVEELTNAQILRVCQFCLVFEHVIDTFMTLPRRADYSRYCRSNLKSVASSRSVAEALTTLSRLKLDKSIGPLIRTFCPRLSAVRNSHRNHKINLLLLNRTRQGTPGRRIEFRQHQGSIDKVEVGAWVTLLTKFVDTVHKMPAPNPEDGTPERFWAIINDSKLRTYYTVKAQTLPSSMTFTYDSRELYAYDSGEEEKSDIDDGTPPEVPPLTPPPAASHSTTSSPVPTPPAHPPHTTRPLLRTTTNPQVLVPSTSGATDDEVGGAKTLDAFDSREGDAFASPRGSRSSSACRQDSEQIEKNSSKSGSQNPTEHAEESARPSFMGDASTMSMQEPALQAVRLQFRDSSSTVSVGNFVLPLPLQIQTLIVGEDASWDAVRSTDADIICSEVEDATDNTSWFITAPTERVMAMAAHRSLQRRMQGGALRWVSPWILEAKKLEMVGLVHDTVQETVLMDDIFHAMISINVSSSTNAEVAQIIAGVVLYEQCLRDILRPQRKSSNHAVGVTENVSVPSSSAQSSSDGKQLQRMVSDLLKPSGQPLSKTLVSVCAQIMPPEDALIDVKDVCETTQVSRGSFSARRALHFKTTTSAASEIVHRAVFLSYMCHHFARRCKESDFTKLAAESVRPRTRKVLVDLISGLPSSVQRPLLH